VAIALARRVRAIAHGRDARGTKTNDKSASQKSPKDLNLANQASGQPARLLREIAI
jgi:hypothetical protein